MSKADRERMYTDEELDSMLKEMKDCSSHFYARAVRIGNHPFIEFCGLINEYVSMCKTTAQANVDFTICNRHVGIPLLAHDYQIKYMAEKFECIFGPVLEDAKNREIFFKAMGWDTTPNVRKKLVDYTETDWKER